MSLDLLFFGLSTESYALPTSEAIEVIRLPKFTMVPRTPPHVLGVFFRRGHLLPLLDLGQRLGLRSSFRPGLLQSTRSDRPAVIVTRSPQGDLGLLVDRILRVEKVPPESLQSDASQAFFVGTVSTAELTALLLNLEALPL